MMSKTVMLVVMVGILCVVGMRGGVVIVQGQDAAEAPEEAVAATADCSSAMEELSVCNASIVSAATTPEPECCDALRSLGPQCMCSVFLGPPIPGIDRDQAFLLPRNCNLPRIRCTPSSRHSDDRLIFFLGRAASDDVDDAAGADDDQLQFSGEWLEEKEGGD